jgi:HAE1 family hydrophobic/amphiphilic exporter-1
MTVVPLFCAKLIKKQQADEELGEGSIAARFGKLSKRFDGYFSEMLRNYDRTLATALLKPVATVVGLAGVSLLCLVLYPLLGVSFFPRTDPGQFVVNLKAPTGSRVELTEDYVKKLEQIVRDMVPKNELQMIVANIGVTPDFSAIYTSNAAPHTAFVQVSLKEGHKLGSYEYMRRVRERIGKDLPQLTTYFQSGGLVDAVLNLGLPAPIDVQVSGSDMQQTYAVASEMASRIRQLKGVSDVLIPQDIDYPALQLDVDREKASQLGLSQKEVVDNVITSLTSNAMIAPNYWIDPKSGNPYLLTVQYPESAVSTLTDLKQIPLRGSKSSQATFLDSVVKVRTIASPTEVDHYQLFRVIDLYVSPKTENLGTITPQIEKILKNMKMPEGARVTLRGSVQGMQASFKSFGIGLILSVVLAYLVLVAQFASWTDPFIILLAVPPGLAGVLLFLLATHTTLNVMSLMGVVMMVGIVVSNSILIVEFARHLHQEGAPLTAAVSTASRLRLRPVLMTSLATLLGLIPMALGIEAGSEQYAPLARAIIGGLLVSVVVTVYLVPAAYLIVHRKEQSTGAEA